MSTQISSSGARRARAGDERPRRGRKKSVARRFAPAVLLVILLGIVVLGTKVVSREEFRKLNPPAFNPASYGREAFPKQAARIQETAIDITELAPAVEDDIDAAGKQYGQDLGSGSYAFPVKATGTVEKVDKDFILLDVADVPSGTAVRIPLGSAISGTPVRDATGTIRYGDFADQNDYQSAANQFAIRIKEDVLSKLDMKTIKGKKLTVYGGWNNGGPPKSFIIQPTTIEVAS